MADDISTSAATINPVQQQRSIEEMKLFAAASNNNTSDSTDDPEADDPPNPSASTMRRVVVVAGNSAADDDGMDDDDDDENTNGSRGGDSSGVANVIDSVIGGGGGGDGLDGDDEGGGSSDEPSFNLRLIEAVRMSRCLYDAADRQYRSADHKIKVWNRLVHTLGFHGDARTLYNRWKQLRDKYGKEKKKMKYNGDLSQWQLFKHLEFLDPHMIDRTQQKFERTKDGKLVYKESNPPIVIADPNFSLNLIHEVRQLPCLFDIKDAKYRHTEFRNQAWSEIIKSLNFPGDINGIYKQWKKIRDRYVREKRKLRMSSNGDTDEPAWDLYRELIWIDPYLDERAAQVKRKRESSEMSDDYLDDSFNMNSSTSSRPPTQGMHQQQQQHSQQQQYAMLMQANQQSQQLQPHIQHLAATAASTSGLGKAQLHSVLPSTSGIQSTARQIRAGTSIGPLASLGHTASSNSLSTATLLAQASNGTALMMQPTLLAGPSGTLHPHHHLQQHHQLGNPHQQLHHQPLLGLGPGNIQPQQHVIITNEPLDGDRAFAMSVAADLSALPEHARNMARAQIQHLLENSKITIVKA